METNQTSLRGRKTLFQYLGYFITLIASYLLGWINHYGVIAVYPYSNPRPLGWAGLAAFLGMYSTIGGFSFKKFKSNPVQKRSLWVLIATMIIGILSFIGGLVVGIKNADVYSTGMDYGVYSYKSTIEKRK